MMNSTAIKFTFFLFVFFNFYPKVCETNKFSCDEGAKCLPLTWLCDSISDCNDNKDELNCPQRRTGKENEGLSGVNKSGN